MKNFTLYSLALAAVAGGASSEKVMAASEINADESRKPIRLFRLHHTCFHEVSGHRVFDKPCKTIGLSDSLTLTAHVLDSYLKHFILLKFHTLIPLLNS